MRIELEVLDRAGARGAEDGLGLGDGVGPLVGAGGDVDRRGGAPLGVGHRLAGVPQRPGRTQPLDHGQHGLVGAFGVALAFLAEIGVLGVALTAAGVSVRARKVTQ